MIPKKILVCTDFSENSSPARICAMAYAKAFKAQLIVFHVVNSRLIGYPTLEQKLPVDMALLRQSIEEGVYDELDLLAVDCRREVDNVHADFRTGDPAEEIVKFAEENQVDLIVVGTHGWSGVKRLILGSTAGRVVRTAQCAVMTVKAGYDKSTGGE
jgi:universal stress protein A